MPISVPKRACTRCNGHGCQHGLLVMCRTSEHTASSAACAGCEGARGLVSAADCAMSESPGHASGAMLSSLHGLVPDRNMRLRLQACLICRCWPRRCRPANHTGHCLASQQQVARCCVREVRCWRARTPAALSCTTLATPAAPARRYTARGHQRHPGSLQRRLACNVQAPMESIHGSS